MELLFICNGFIKQTNTSECYLLPEAVEGVSLTLESVHDIHCGNGRATSVIGVQDSIMHHFLEKNPEGSACMFINEARDTLHTTTVSETTDGIIGNSFDVAKDNLPVTLDLWMISINTFHL